MLFCCTNKKAQYFDLQVMVAEHGADDSVLRGDVAVSSFSDTHRPVRGVRHSGDIGSLLHYATIDTAAAAQPDRGRGGRGEGTNMDQIDEDLVQRLMGMGFPENGCRRAVLAAGHLGVDSVTDWIFAHENVILTSA